MLTFYLKTPQSENVPCGTNFHERPNTTFLSSVHSYESDASKEKSKVSLNHIMQQKVTKEIPSSTANNFKR